MTALQEVTIEAHANDDYGIAQLDLVYAVRGGREQVVTLKKGPRPHAHRRASVVGSFAVRRDFVTYFARARDVGRGRKNLEVRSDIFFLEVKPYDEEFVAAQSQAGSSGNERSLEELAQAQKDIIVATWKLDRRALDGAPGRSQQDILQIARAQGEVQDRARETAAGLQFSMASGGLGGGRGTSRGAGPTTANPVFEAIVKATVAMGRAKEELQALNTSSATPHEMEALNQILKRWQRSAEAVNRSQQTNSSRRRHRAQRDLSTLFDRELRRQQETNYEESEASDRQDGQTRAKRSKRFASWRAGRPI